MLALAFALMLFAFRSPVLAAKAIVLNLLSVAAAYGLLVLVFQHGIGESLLGFPATDGIDPVVPLLLFVILFGLSMDYHVFILSRIREAVQRGVSTEDAVAHGIKTTAGVVTSAAIVMVAVFSVFVALSYMFFKEFGIGLAAAILLDATIVRGVLLPASMKLLGDWNWWVPSWLQWLPRFDVDGEPEPARARFRDSGLRLEAEGVVLMAASAHSSAFPPGRIVALVLLALAVLVLGYARIASGDVMAEHGRGAWTWWVPGWLYSLSA